MRLKFSTSRQNDWKCCFCCHVRTGTIFLGIWHLMLHVLALSVIAVVIRHPEMVRDMENTDPVLPTPLSETDDSVVEIIGSKSNIQLTLQPKLYDSPLRHSELTPHEYRDLFGRRDYNEPDLNIGIVVTFITFAITLLMVFGAIKGKPSFLMPFFCLQIFDFCIASLTAVGYLCYLPDVHRLVAENTHLPYREQLLHLNPECLSLLVLLTFMVAMMVKAYFIGVVWGCYKYLTLRQAASQRTIHFIDPDSQSLLPDLPDYETAIGDPRFAIKKFPTPPPSYAVAVAYPPPPAATQAEVVASPEAPPPQVEAPSQPTEPRTSAA